MNKLAFLSALRSKLGILNADEINDIIDEYSGYIESKMAEGKSEEEAVNDFGSVEDLASEILDAYKINREYAKEKQDSPHSKAESRQTAIDDFMSNLGDILNQTIEYASRFFRNIFQDYSVESLAQLLVIFLVAMIIIAFMKIPFFIIEAIGRAFIHFILPYGAANIIVLFWGILVNIIYFLIAILVIAGLIQGVMDKKDISQSIREMFHRTGRSMKYQYKHPKRETNKSSDANKTTIIYPTDKSDSDVGSTIHDEANISSDSELRATKLTILTEPMDSNREFEETMDNETNDTSINEPNEEQSEKQTNNKTSVGQTKTRPKRSKRTEYQPHQSDRESRTWVDMILEMMIGLLKAFVLLILIPFYGAMLGIAIAIGAMIYLLFQGISIFGFIILALGVLSLIGTFTSFVWYLLDRRKSYRFHSYKASIMTSCVLLGFGGVFSFFNVMSFDYEHSPKEFATFSEKKNLYYDLADKEAIFHFGTSQIMLVEDNQLKDGRIKVELQYHDKNAYLDEYTENDTTYIFINQYNNRFGEFKFVVDTMIEGLRNNKIYNIDYYSTFIVNIHANSSTLAKLNMSYNKINYHP